MKTWRILALHGGLLVLSSVLALRAASDVEAPRALGENEVLVWRAGPSALESVRFESKKQTVVFMQRTDASGPWYEVRVEREAKAPAKPPASENATQATPQEREKLAFVSVVEGRKAAESLAPLVAVRAVGRVEDARLAEFGLDEPSATLKVRISGRDHTLQVGGATPGGQDRYVRHTESNEVFALAGDVIKRFEAAETRLLERALHDFGDEPPTRVELHHGDKKRELVTASGKAGGWADAGSSQANETATNWLGKLDRLRVKSYAEDEQKLEPRTPVFRVEYFAGKRPVGRLELYREGASDAAAKGASDAPAAAAAKYFVRTEHTRWPVEVPSSAAAELEQEIGSVLE